MLTGTSDQKRDVPLEVLRAARSRRGNNVRDDPKFLEALH